MVARMVRDHEAPGSSPGTSTKKSLFMQDLEKLKTVVFTSNNSFSLFLRVLNKGIKRVNFFVNLFILRRFKT